MSHRSLERGSPVISLESARVSTTSREIPLISCGTESSCLVSSSLEESGPFSPVTEFDRSRLKKGEVIVNPHCSDPGLGLRDARRRSDCGGVGPRPRRASSRGRVDAAELREADLGLGVPRRSENARNARGSRGRDRQPRAAQGHTRVLQLYINLSVWRSNMSEKASTFRALEER